MKKTLLPKTTKMYAAILRYILLGGLASLIFAETFAQNHVYYPYSNNTTSTNTANFVDSKLNIYPNPTAGNFSIDLQVASSEAVHLQVYNLIGQQVAEQWNYPEAIHSTIKFNLYDLPEGVYFVEATASNMKMVKRLIIRR